MGYITDKGIISMVLMSDALILGSVVLILLIARSLSGRQPDESKRIIRSAYIVSTAIVIVFGVIAETIIVLKVLWTVGFI
jgi:hypothetical protein